MDTKLSWLSDQNEIMADAGYERSEPVQRQEVDMVNHPPHYTQGGIECIDAIRAALGRDGFIAFCQGQIIKYTWRCQHKGKALEDIQKSDFYSQRLKKELEDDGDWLQS